MEAGTQIGSVLAAATGRRRRTWAVIRRVIGAAAIVLCALTSAQASDLDRGPPAPNYASDTCHVARVGAYGPNTEDGPEPDNTGVHITLDEHLLVDPRRDSDYNG